MAARPTAILNGYKISNDAAKNNVDKKRVPFRLPSKQAHSHEDFILPYVNDLRSVIDTDAICKADLKMGVDPLGGIAALLGAISSVYQLNISVANRNRQPSHL
jgi:phosphoglucomutase